MNPITDLIFTLTWFILLVWAIRSMAKGWGLMTQPVQRSDVNGMYTTQVTKPVHPEMKDVEPGTELMGVNFKQREVDELNLSLQERIDELSQEEDDDDGDIIVRI